MSINNIIWSVASVLGLAIIGTGIIYFAANNDDTIIRCKKIIFCLGALVILCCICVRCGVGNKIQYRFDRPKIEMAKEDGYTFYLNGEKADPDTIVYDDYTIKIHADQKTVDIKTASKSSDENTIFFPVFFWMGK